VEIESKSRKGRLMKIAKASPDLRVVNFFKTNFDIDLQEGEIDLSKIDWKASENNGARPRYALDNDLVSVYRQGMEQGDSFPMCVFLKTKDENGEARYEIHSGRHRVDAYLKLKVKSIRAYWYTTSDKFISDIVPRQLNVFEGRGLTRDELVAHALYIMKVYKYSQKDVAKMFKVPASYIGDGVRANEVKGLLAALGIDCIGVKDSPILQIYKYKQYAQVLKLLGLLITKYKVKGEELDSLLKTIDNNDQSKWEKLLTNKVNEKSRIRTVVKLPGRQNRRTTFLRFLGTFGNMIAEAIDLNSLQITEVEEIRVIQERLYAVEKDCRRLRSVRGTSNQRITHVSPTNNNGHSRGRKMAPTK